MITAKASDQTYTSQMIYDLYVRSTSVMFISAAAVFILCGFAYEKSVLGDLREYRDGLARQDEQREEDGEGEAAGLSVLVKALGIVRYAGGSGTGSRKLSQRTIVIAKRVRRPIMLLGPVAGLLGALQQSFMRGFTLALSTPGCFSQVSTYVYGICGISLAACQLMTINRMMRIYPQLEIQPIYETSLIVFNLFCGAIILDEKKMYTSTELVRLAVYCLICISGVFSLIKKPSLLN